MGTSIQNELELRSEGTRVKRAAPAKLPSAIQALHAPFASMWHSWAARVSASASLYRLVHFISPGPFIVGTAY